MLLGTAGVLLIAVPPVTRTPPIRKMLHQSNLRKNACVVAENPNAAVRTTKIRPTQMMLNHGSWMKSQAHWVLVVLLQTWNLFQGGPTARVPREVGYPTNPPLTDADAVGPNRAAANPSTATAARSLMEVADLDPVATHTGQHGPTFLPCQNNPAVSPMTCCGWKCSLLW